MAGARHLLGVNLRRPHQPRVCAQPRASAAGPFDVRQIDNFGCNTGCGSRRYARHLGAHRCRADADDAAHRRHPEPLPLTGHAEESAIDAPVRLCEIPFVKGRISTGVSERDHLRVTNLNAGSRNCRWPPDPVMATVSMASVDIGKPRIYGLNAKRNQGGEERNRPARSAAG